MPERRPCILVIDDDEDFCRLVTGHLERCQFDVVAELTSDAGLRRLQGGNIDAVVLDHILPAEDGLVTLARISSMPGAPPVIYLTSSQDSRVAVAALKSGASDYVAKDVHGEFLDLLETAVTHALKTAGIRRAIAAAEEEVLLARDKFASLAEERALLLGEVNHRVSNSLQLIASLLHFQADLSDSGDVKAALKEANGRVMAVARVHRWLYVSEDVRAISLAGYLQTLIADLDGVSGAAETAAPISVEAEPIDVEPDKAVAVGIITTELILGAFKHAQPDIAGPVRVLLARGEPGWVQLIVEDEGPGIQRSIEAKGLGQRIIRGMAEKLDGDLRYESAGRGTRAVLVFPAHSAEARGDASD